MDNSKRRDKYRKIPLKIKVQFLKKILQEGTSIKSLASFYKINYSTAKTIYRNEKLKKSKTKLSELVDSKDDDNLMPKQLSSSVPECGYFYIPCPQVNQIEDKQGRGQNEAEETPKRVTKVEIVSRVIYQSSSN